MSDLSNSDNSSESSSDTGIPHLFRSSGNTQTPQKNESTNTKTGRVRHLSSFSYQFENYLQSSISELLSAFRNRVSDFVGIVINHVTVPGQLPNPTPTPGVNESLNYKVFKGNIGALNNSFSLIRDILIRIGDVIAGFQRQLQTFLFREVSTKNDQDYGNTYIQFTFQILYYLIEVMGDLLNRLKSLMRFSTYFLEDKISFPTSPMVSLSFLDNSNFMDIISDRKSDDTEKNYMTGQAPSTTSKSRPPSSDLDKEYYQRYVGDKLPSVSGEEKTSYPNIDIDEDKLFPQGKKTSKEKLKLIFTKDSLEITKTIEAIHSDSDSAYDQNLLTKGYEMVSDEGTDEDLECKQKVSGTEREWIDDEEKLLMNTYTYKPEDEKTLQDNRKTIEAPLGETGYSDSQRRSLPTESLERDVPRRRCFSQSFPEDSIHSAARKYLVAHLVDNIIRAARDDAIEYADKAPLFEEEETSSEKEPKTSTPAEFSGFIYNPGPKNKSECRGFILLPPYYQKEGSGPVNESLRDKHCVVSLDLTEFSLRLKEKMRELLLLDEEREREGVENESKTEMALEVFHVLKSCCRNTMRWSFDHDPGQNVHQPTATSNREGKYGEVPRTNTKESSSTKGGISGQHEPSKNADQEVRHLRMQGNKDDDSGKEGTKTCRCTKETCPCKTSTLCHCAKEGIPCKCPNCKLKKKKLVLNEQPREVETKSCTCGRIPCRCAKNGNSSSAEGEIFFTCPTPRQARKIDAPKHEKNKNLYKTCECKNIPCACRTGDYCPCIESGKFCTCMGPQIKEPTKQELVDQSCDCINMPCPCTTGDYCPCVQANVPCRCSSHESIVSEPVITEPNEQEEQLFQVMADYIRLVLENLALPYKDVTQEYLNNVNKTALECLSNFVNAMKPRNYPVKKLDKECQTAEDDYPSKKSVPKRMHVKFDAKPFDGEFSDKVCESCAEDIEYYFSDLRSSRAEEADRSSYPEDLYVTSSQMLHPNHDTLPVNVLEVREIVNGQLRVYTDDWLEDGETIGEGEKYQSRWTGTEAPTPCLANIDVSKPSSDYSDCSFRIIYNVGGNLPKKVPSKTNIGTAGETKGLKLSKEIKEKSPTVNIPTSSWPGNYPFTAEDAKQTNHSEANISESHLQNKIWIFHDDLKKARYGDGPPLVLKLRRAKFLEEAFETLMCPSRIPLNYYQDIRVYFKRENGVLEDKERSQELISLLSRQLFSPFYFQLFDNPSDDSPALYLNPASTANPKIFQFAGVIFALSLIHRKQLGVKLPLAFFKCLLDRPFSIKDLEEIDPPLYQKLRWLKRTRLSKSNVRMTFSVKDRYGKHTYYRELIPDGSTVLVTDANKAGFCELVVKWKLAERCFQQFKEFRRGVIMVLEPCLFSVFTAEELQFLMARTVEDGPLTSPNSKMNSGPNRRGTW